MRTCFGSTLRISAMLPLMPNAPWEGAWSVKRPLAGSCTDRRARLHRVHDHAAVDELEPGNVRGLGEGGGYLLAVAEVIVERDIAGRFVVDERRARTRASSGRTTAGSASMSTSTASAASFACNRVSATTKATGSPTKRTLSVASAGRGGRFMGVPSRLLNGTMHLSVPRRQDRRRYRRRARPAFCAPPPYHALDHAMGNAAADHHGIGFAGELDIVGVAALSRTSIGSSVRRTGWPMPNFISAKLCGSF
jgi:hypothetical protein